MPLHTINPPPIANPYDSGSELENPRGFEYNDDLYNRSSLAHELGGVGIELNKGFAAHRPHMSFDSELSLSTDQGYDYNYAPDSPHRNKSAKVTPVESNVNAKSPHIPAVAVRPAIASASTSTLASAFRFGGERMIRAQTGLLAGRPSLEEGCLTAHGDGEDVGMGGVGVGFGGLRTCLFFSLFLFQLLINMYETDRPTPVFSRPSAPTSGGRSRSSTCTSSSVSGGDTTPPLSASDGSSISGGSQSSIELDSVDIDLARVNAAFGSILGGGGGMNATHPAAASVTRAQQQQQQAQARARARGTGHRRRYSKGGGGASVSAHMSRSSVYETIEEETAGLGSSTNSRATTVTADADAADADADADLHTVSMITGMSPPFLASAPSSEFGSTAKLGKVGLNTRTNNDSPTIHQPVYIVDADTASFQHHQGRSNGSQDFDFGSNEYGVSSIWDDERGIVALRKYYALRDEAQTTVKESRRMWLDTPFSLFAIQCKWSFLSCISAC